MTITSRIKPALLPLVLGLLAGCGEPARPALEPVVRDSADVLIHEFPGAVLDRPNPILAVLEQVPAEVRVFDGSGRFLHRVGRAGDGPGEFRTPVGLVAVPGDTLLLWDRGRSWSDAYPRIVHPHIRARCSSRSS